MKTWMYMRAYDPTPDYLKQAGDAGWEFVLPAGRKYIEYPIKKQETPRNGYDNPALAVWRNPAGRAFIRSPPSWAGSNQS